MSQNVTKKILCYVCMQMEGHIRPRELYMARITGKAHVDCNGHSQYRRVFPSEIRGELT